MWAHNLWSKQERPSLVLGEQTACREESSQAVGKQGLSFLKTNFNQNEVEPLSSRRGSPFGMPYPILLGVGKRVQSSSLKPGMSRD